MGLLRIWLGFAPAGTDGAVQRLGVDAGDQVAQERRDYSDGDEERGNRGERHAYRNEQSEQGEDYKHVGEVYLVAALTQIKKRSEEAWSFPVGLGGGGDDEAGAQRNEGHVQTCAIQAQPVGLNRKTKSEDKENGADGGHGPKCAWGEATARED